MPVTPQYIFLFLAFFLLFAGCQKIAELTEDAGDTGGNGDLDADSDSDSDRDSDSSGDSDGSDGNGDFDSEDVNSDDSDDDPITCLWTVGLQNTFEIDATANSITVADFNADGILDLATASIGNYPEYTGTVTLYQGQGVSGQGNGTFTKSYMYPVGRTATAIIHQDFNSDGIGDLAVANMADNSVAILLGLGSNGVANGTFQLPTHYPTGENPNFLVSEDFNSDGIMDLAISNWGGFDDDEPDSVALLLGQGKNGVGDGTFDLPILLQTPDKPVQLVAADFNDDGTMDLAVTSEANKLGVFLTGTDDESIFKKPVYYDIHYDPYSLTAGDFNGDGILDLAVSTVAIIFKTHSSHGVSILLGQGENGVGNGIFDLSHFVDVMGIARSMSTADFNKDSILDLVGTNGVGVDIVYGNGTNGGADGNFICTWNYLFEEHVATHVVADFNQDGVWDIAVPNSYNNNITILLGELTGDCSE